jgi:hypothetical protein
MKIILIFSFFIQILCGQTTDLIKQADGVFTKLNSNETAKMVTKIANNLNQALEIMNSDEAHQILHNLRKMTEESKVYIDISDRSWEINRVMICLEILLVIIIIILLFLFGICIYKIVKKNKRTMDLNTDYYNVLNELEDQNRNIIE